MPAAGDVVIRWRNRSYHLFGVYGRSDAIFEPAMAALVAGRLHMNDNAAPSSNRKTLGFDIFNGGVRFLSACQIATAMIDSGSHRCAMVVASAMDCEFRTDGRVLPADRGEWRIADTASAVILEQCEVGDTGFGTFLFRNFPEYADISVVDTVQMDGVCYLRSRNSGDLKSLYLHCIPAVVRELLSIERIDLSELTCVIGPQLGASVCSTLSKALGLPEHCVVNVANDDVDLFYFIICVRSGPCETAGHHSRRRCWCYHFRDRWNSNWLRNLSLLN